MTEQFLYNMDLKRLFHYLKLCNKTNKCSCSKYVNHLLLITKMFSKRPFFGFVMQVYIHIQSCKRDCIRWQIHIFLVFPLHSVGILSRASATRQGGCTESCHTEGPFTLCLCLCTAGLHPKVPLHSVWQTSAWGSQTLRSFWGRHATASTT
jgi:hypothetical protein